MNQVKQVQRYASQMYTFLSRALKTVDLIQEAKPIFHETRTIASVSRLRPSCYQNPPLHGEDRPVSADDGLLKAARKKERKEIAFILLLLAQTRRDRLDPPTLRWRLSCEYIGLGSLSSQSGAVWALAVQTGRGAEQMEAGM